MYHQRVFILTEAPEQCFCRDMYVGFMVLPGRTLLYIVIVGVLMWWSTYSCCMQGPAAEA